MADTVEVEFAHFHGDHKPGDKANLSPDEAHTLVFAGVANYATKPEARKAGGDPQRAATARG